MKLPRRPTADAPIDLQWSWDVCDAFRALQPMSGAGTVLNLGPGGFSYSVPARSPSIPSLREPFELSILAGVAMLTNCVVMIGMVFVELDDMEVSVASAADGDYIGLVYDSNNDALENAVTAAVGGDGVAYDSSFHASSQYVRRPIYRLKRSGSNPAYPNLRVAGIPHFMVYQS